MPIVATGKRDKTRLSQDEAGDKIGHSPGQNLWPKLQIAGLQKQEGVSRRGCPLALSG